MPSRETRKTTPKGGPPKKREDDTSVRRTSSPPAIRKEIKYLIMVGVGILLLLSVFFANSLGFVGPFFRNILRGFFGLGGALIPVAILAYAILGLISREVIIPWKRGLVLVWLFLGLLYVIVDPVGDNAYSAFDSAFEYLQAVYRSESWMAGGLMGAFLGRIAVALVARIGAGIIFAIAIILLLINITNRSFVQLVEGGVTKARNYYDERKDRHSSYEDDEEQYEDDFEDTHAKKVTPEIVTPVPVKRVAKSMKRPAPRASAPAPAPPPPPVPELRHLEEVRVVSKKGTSSELITIDSLHDDNDDFEILLVQEEMDGVVRKRREEVLKDEIPFAARGASPYGRRSTDIKIVGASDEDDDIKEIEQMPVEPDAVALGIAEAFSQIGADLSPSGDVHSDFIYEPEEDRDEYVSIYDRSHAKYKEKEYRRDRGLVELDEKRRRDDVLEASDVEEIEQPHEANPGVVVRGLVGDTTSEKPPLYDYDDGQDPLEYDEYSRITRAPVPASLTLPAAAAVSRDSVQGEEPVMRSVCASATASHRPAAPPIIQEPEEPDYSNFELPEIDLLIKGEKPLINAESRAQVLKNSRVLEETLRSFRIEAEVVEVSVGPTVTRYDLSPGPGVKVSSIANLSNDLALSLAAQGIRIEAPIPGKSAVGIEIPNKEPQGVFLREILESKKFEAFPSKLAFCVGKDIAGDPVVADVADMPHLLIAGATGAGKSVCINTLIASLLYKARPDEVKLLMVDPKVVELSVYNGIPHLLIPVVTDPKKASGALNWAVQEMESRYQAFAETGCRDLKGYNRYLEENTDNNPLPQIVIIIDELADLMMTCKGEVEEAICRLAQKARAAGIHLIVATQRPSVDVITGLIKANIPSRLAFAVSSGTDSRTVLDMQGAEKLLGRGDMLFLPRGQNKPIRVQGCFISDKEVESLVAFLKAQAPISHTTEMIQQITMPGKAKIEGETDEFFHDAVEFLLVKGKASTSMLQRQFRIGYNRASRLMDDLEMRGIVGPEDGVKPRKVTITRDEYREIYGA